MGSAPRRARPGSAAFLVLVFTIALAALAGSAVLLTSGGRLVSNYHDQEHDLRYGAAAALQIGISTLANSPFAVPETGYVQLATSSAMLAADGTPVPSVTYDLFAGPTGAASQQHGRFVTLVAVAKDTIRHRQFIRRGGAESGDVCALRVFFQQRKRDLLRIG